MQKNQPGSEISLFNGTDLSGWEVHGLGKWYVHDEILTVKRGLGYVSTRFDRFKDFILTLQVRVSKKGNSGVFFRAKHPGVGFRPWPVGYEAQIDHHDPQNYTGSLYDRVKADRLITQDDQWFEMKISCWGSSIKIYIEGECIVDTMDPSYESGFIALQAHDPFCQVDFRHIRLRIPSTKRVEN